MKKVFLVALLSCTSLFGGIDPGDLDISFGSGGIVITNLGGTDRIEGDVVIQPDRKIIGSGRTSVGPNSDNFALVRYNPDGTLDHSFGESGIIITDFGGDDESFALVLQFDGKILAGGKTTTGPNPDNFGLIRYHADGNIDLSFGDNGFVVTDFGAGSEQINALIVQKNDNKIIAIGNTAVGPNPRNLAVVRYNPDGSIDTMFGTNGVTIVDSGAADVHSSVALQEDNKIVTVGTATGGVSSIMLARLNSDGTRDLTFGNNGIVLTNLSSATDTGVGIVLQANEKIIVGGYTNTSPNQFALARYNSDGTLDGSFGQNGIVTSENTRRALGISMQIDGKILITGFGDIGPPVNNIITARYNKNGTLDTSFGQAGVVFTSINRFDAGFDIVVQADGKIVVGGSANNDFVLVRYISGLDVSKVTQALFGKYALDSARNKQSNV